jgi:hypothetical protein
LTICVAGNTTTSNVINAYSEKLKPVYLGTGESIAEAFVGDRCNVFAGGLSEVLDAEDKLAETDSIVEFSNISLYDYVIEPLALVTQQDDAQWADFVSLVVTATFYAEENGISMANANSDMPEVTLFGSRYTQMLRHAISAVGSYKDIYRRNIQDRYERSGFNLLYSKNSSTPLLYAPHDLRIAKD